MLQFICTPLNIIPHSSLDPLPLFDEPGPLPPPPCLPETPPPVLDPVPPHMSSLVWAEVQRRWSVPRIISRLQSSAWRMFGGRYSSDVTGDGPLSGLSLSGHPVMEVADDDSFWD